MSDYTIAIFLVVGLAALAYPPARNAVLMLAAAVVPVFAITRLRKRQAARDKARADQLSRDDVIDRLAGD